MRTVEYTHSFRPDSPSEIRVVYYNDTDQELYVQFEKDGRMAAYEWVPRDTYDSFHNAYSAESAYDYFIRGHFPEIDSDVNFVPYQHEESGVTENQVQATPHKYEVTYTLTYQKVVSAASVDDAIAKVRRITGFNNIQVKEVKVTFDD